MTIIVESRRRKLENVERRWPEASIIDMTSKGEDPWVRFSPFYPHGGIPIPNTPDQTAQSVEGLWQGLKVFEEEDIDPGRWAITNMTGIKRGGKISGSVRGHRFGVGNDILLGYREARFRIYLPAYKWVLENCLTDEVEELRQSSLNGTLVLLDYETNLDPEDLNRPLSHAGLIKCHIEEAWPEALPLA